MTSKQTIKDFYRKKYADKKWTPITPTRFSSLRYDAVAYYSEGKGKALEIGGGDGELAQYLSKFYDEYIVTEFVSPRVNRLKKLLYFGNCPEIKVLENDIEEEPLPYPDGYFDFILMCSVIEHLLEPVSIIKYCHKLLKPNGRVLIYTPNLFKWTRRAKVLFGVFPKTGGGDEELLDGGHLHYLTHNYLKKLILDYGQFREFKILPHGKGLKYLYAPFFSECLVVGVK